MAVPWADWDHILKVDPDKPLPDGVSYADVCQMGTDALEIGGTRGVTEEKMARVIDACSRYDVPLFQEPSSTAAVVHDEGLDGYLVPTVMNSRDATWVVGVHKEWVRLDPDIKWDQTWTEAYIILNPDSAVADYADADCDLRADDVAAYATVAERLLGQAIVYVEYSGTYGDPAMVSAAADALDEATCFYGGGIKGYDAAYEMRSVADTVVVGDLLHDEGVEAVQATIDGAKDAAADREA
ncbi:MAG: putative phosphoglycerol geranylgeranyltransferase [Halobacteriales archaeon]|nr:putative phosphoglycerol geranylgeranyltransferase [Halobacteriales archaeon]